MFLWQRRLHVSSAVDASTYPSALYSKTGHTLCNFSFLPQRVIGKKIAPIRAALLFSVSRKPSLPEKHND